MKCAAHTFVGVGHYVQQATTQIEERFFFAMKEELYYMIVEYIKHITGILDYNI